ncbi:BsuPI-related putative proteinase inhibitor [Metabacillus iocasae]|uniref:Intracellular proteinase inhibitor BsuPI domain-containing protein n=1 Tax=Priestia iocasae TaxID=2291674 RepID=A0ABS2QRH7_9BACI|nr:BsuPI-related putative proteinase inhibitor [Metabacillus iocasae]MBM7702056.1 hypothetical protein [Metabacillus iocasae]
MYKYFSINGRLVSVMIGLNLTVIGCGQETHTENTVKQVNGGQQMTEQLVGDAVITNEKNGRVKIVYTVNNQSEEDVELEFPNGLKADYVLYDEAGNKIAKYSEGVFTTMAIEHLMLNPHQEFVQEFTINNLKSGKYSITLFLNVAGKKGKVTKSFSV